jgi:hypothetical protein
VLVGVAVRAIAFFVAGGTPLGKRATLDWR